MMELPLLYILGYKCRCLHCIPPTQQMCVLFMYQVKEQELRRKLDQESQVNLIYAQVYKSRKIKSLSVETIQDKAVIVAQTRPIL